MKRSLVAALILAFSSVGAVAAEPPAACCAQKQSDGGVPYVSGGVGEDERAALTAAAADYNLKLVFAEKGTGHYLSDVKVSITGRKGASVLEAVADGPWFLAKLPPGSYQISVAAEDRRQTRSVTVGKTGRKTLSFHF